ncbi:hypothetical protein [Shewanella sp.]|uniref:hypothetical protein n=1 Tax=Shewanella sp. TaxID=50422 RepID=UPI001EC6C718|nr:hypothetical protein [Shewanella sp.]NRB22478.1 hypothetical protein [Shewanella sp.]
MSELTKEEVQTKTRPAAKTAKPKAAANTRSAKNTRAEAVTTSRSKGGKTPKELWREKLAGKGQLPRGF